jgi:hypothetical protein
VRCADRVIRAHHGRLAAALLALAGGAAWGQAPADSALSWDVSAGALHRRLVERADNGSRLVTETGPMLRLGFGMQLRLAQGGALRLDLGAAGGRLDYEGRTQAGAPVSTTTRHREVDLALAWRPLAAAAWGEGWLVLRGLEQRRTIASTATVGGLEETSTVWMPGLRWTGAFDGAGWRWQPSIELRASVRHRLDIDYRGVFDPSALKGGRRHDVVLGLAMSAPDSPWQWSVEWTHARQSASPRQPLYRGGVAVGTVRQPRILVDDVSVRLRRSF